MGYNSVADNTGLSFVQLLLVPESAKFRRIRADSSVQSSKVIDLGVNRKLICDFLLVINSNFGLPTSEIFTFKARKWLVLPTPLPLFDATLGEHIIISR